MTLKELKKNLASVPDFKDINSWKFEAIKGGIVALHKYKISNDGQSYFVKDVKENEKNILKILFDIQADFIPKIVFPKMLDKNILISEYINGGQMVGKNLDKELLIGFTKFQNLLNNKNYTDFSSKDSGFFKNYISLNFNYGLRCLRLLRKFDLETVKENLTLLDYLRTSRKEIIKDFSSMPFARQHHDFKEDNIIGHPQKLVDWGSSYGYGPFLFDLAPFLLNDRVNYELFIQNSDICKIHNRQSIDRWLYVASVARYVENLHYRLRDNGLLDDKESCRKYLEYDYDTYKTLYKA